MARRTHSPSPAQPWPHLLLAGVALIAGCTSLARSQPASSLGQSAPHSDSAQQRATTEEASFEAYEEIEQAIQPYLDSAATGDGALARGAFLDHAHVVGSVGGQHYNMSADEFGQAITAGGASPQVRHRIAWIDVSGPAAAAKVEFIDWDGVRYTDYLILYRHEGSWRISGKVYDSHSNN